MTLLEHREVLLSNPNRYTQDAERAIMQFAQSAYKNIGNQGSNKKKLIPLYQKLGQLVIEAQGYKPLYDYESDLPRAWNSPMKGGWKLNYIKYEIGHLISVNNGGSFKPENLSFQSARCNQHVQTSMNYNETTEYAYIEEVRNRVNNLFILHKSKEWLDIINYLNLFQYKGVFL
jgi:hypothetical protein